MRKRQKAFRRAVSLIILALLILPLAEAGLGEEADPVVIRVQDVIYTRSQIRPALETDFNLAMVMTGVYLSDDERAERMQETLDRCVGAALIQVKLEEAGKNDFTHEEEETLKEAARARYEEIWQGIWQKAKDSGEEFTEEQVSEFLEDMGYTVGAIFEEMKNLERRYRAAELFCPGLALTEGMVQEYYETNFLTPDRERYAEDIALYEQEILADGNESFYTPEGYRGIRQILLAYPDEVIRGLKNENARCNLDSRLLAGALQQLAAAAAEAESWEDLSESRAAYDEAAAEMEAARRDYTEKRKAKTEPLIRETVEKIQEEYAAGIDIGTIIRRYSTDQSESNLKGEGYPFHPESKNWTPEFSSAAASLEKPGDLSGPVYSDLGIHILYYQGDIPGGAHALTAEEKEILTASAREYYQGLELQQRIEGWKTEYEIEVHPELLEE